jgi:hypothetical protein
MTMILLCSPELTPDERGLQILAEFFGLQVRAISEPVTNVAEDRAIHIAATCDSLKAFTEHPSGRQWLTRRLSAYGSSLFLTGVTSSEHHLTTLESLVPGVVQSVSRLAPDARPYEIPPDLSNGLQYFAGLSFGRGDSEIDGTFTLMPGAAGVTELVTVGGRPCYVKVERGAVAYFLLACERVLDINGPAEAGQQPVDRFLQFVPFLAYLREAFGTQCWHNQRPAACFIVDDPLLTPRYGFLDFDRLDSLMEHSRLSTNIAFIPWNWRRTDSRVVEKFRRPDRRLSISIHGCDHTEAEFGITDERRLRFQSRRALVRMEAHERLTGIRHNRVMIFPQGVFSKASLRALADEGFLAAANSTIYPVDAAPGEITFRDLLEVAVVENRGVPLFMRHYPNRPEKFALDLFLGRQVLIVEHHSFFKHGYEAIERCAAFVNRLAPHIRWTDLDELCTSACLVREVPADGVYVQAFGPVVRLRNDRNERVRYHVWNRSARYNLESVGWMGRALAFEKGPTGATCVVDLGAKEEGERCFRRAPSDDAVQYVEPEVGEHVRVFVRRHLSEFRDKHLAKSTILQGLASAGKRLLPRL